MSGLTERIPPHSNDAEQYILGSILIDPDALGECVEIIRGDDFYSGIHKEIYEASLDLYRKNEPIDTVTLTERLKSRKSLKMVGGHGFIAKLSTLVPSTANVSAYASIIAEKASLRRLIASSSEIIEQAYEDSHESNEILDLAERNIFEIAQSRQKKGFVAIKDVLAINLKKIDEISAFKGNLIGVTTGFKDLDRKTSGFQKSDLVMIAARPSMGKTALALNIAQRSAINGKSSVAIFSLEMANEQLTQRMLSMESKIDMQKIKTGSLEDSDWQKIQMALDRLSETDIYIDDTAGISVMEMKNKCRRLKLDKGLDMIIIDYLQLMSLDHKTENRQQEISIITRSLKQLARELDVPVIALSQLSRAPEQRTGNHRPILSDLRESGSIEQDADMVMFLYRDEYYNPETERPNVCEVIMAKHRNGETGTVELAWFGQYTRFEDVYKT